MKRAAIVGVVLLVAQHAGAQCLGDFNGDGTVSINELIIAVNNSLNGCQVAQPTPTPTAVAGTCPIDFSTDNSLEGPDCFYIGPWNPADANCPADLQAQWTSILRNPTDPTSIDLVVVQFLGLNPPLFYGAATTSPTSAELIGWFQTPNPTLADIHVAPGLLTLGDSGGILELVPDSVSSQSDCAPFDVVGCAFVHYSGSLTEVSQGAQPAARLRQHIDPTALNSLRAARAEHAAPPNLERR